MWIYKGYRTVLARPPTKLIPQNEAPKWPTVISVRINAFEQQNTSNSSVNYPSYPDPHYRFSSYKVCIFSNCAAQDCHPSKAGFLSLFILVVALLIFFAVVANYTDRSKQ
jgi:hypothetical protein